MNPVDCVILWVDGSDPLWVREKLKYSGKLNSISEDDEISRYRDWGILKYLFRGIEKNAKWIRNVYFVTCGQKPAWLDTNNTRLKLIDHKDYIPEKYLPTFNSHPIELNLHRIEGLSDSFLYFNDDMFILKETKREDFFKGDIPCDSAVLNAIAMKKGDKSFRFLMPINDIEIINKYFNKKEVIKSNLGKYFSLKYGKDLLRTVALLPWIHFTGFVNYHFPYSIRKRTLEELWEKEPDVMDATCSSRFRNSNDVNIWLALYWQYAKGDFYPRDPKIGSLVTINDDKKNNEDVIALIKSKKHKVIVINDTVTGNDYDRIRDSLIEAFESLYPEKSGFEI